MTQSNIHVFSPSGVLLEEFPDIHHPPCVVVNSTEFFFVVSPCCQHVKVYHLDGRGETSFHAGVDSPCSIAVNRTDCLPIGDGQSGTDAIVDRELMRMRSLQCGDHVLISGPAIDAMDDVFINDSNGGLFRVFTPSGRLIGGPAGERRLHRSSVFPVIDPGTSSTIEASSSPI